MSKLIRFGVSIDESLLKNFDRLIGKRNYANRSEAIRDLIRDALIQQKIDSKSKVNALGSLTLIYDHHSTNLPIELGEIQHKFHQNILSVMHLHVSHNDCMEMIALKGLVPELVELSNSLISLKGIKNGKLFLTFASSEINKL